MGNQWILIVDYAENTDYADYKEVISAPDVMTIIMLKCFLSYIL